MNIYPVKAYCDPIVCEGFQDTKRVTRPFARQLLAIESAQLHCSSYDLLIERHSLDAANINFKMRLCCLLSRARGSSTSVAAVEDTDLKYRQEVTRRTEKQEVLARVDRTALVVVDRTPVAV